MKRIAFAALLAISLVGFASKAKAQNVTWNWTFVAVDAVSVKAYDLYVTGILEGGATPVEASVNFSSYATSSYDMLAACQRMALLAMERPGQYKLQLSFKGTSGSVGYPACRLVRVNP